MITFTSADLVDGVLTKTLEQLGLKSAYAPVQVLDDQGVIQDGSAVVVVWSDTQLKVDVSNVEDFTGTWKLIFSVSGGGGGGESLSTLYCNLICLSLIEPGAGGVGGGGGTYGQVSGLALGFGASSYGIPVIKTTTGLTSDFLIQLTRDIEGTVPSNLTNITKILFQCLTNTVQGKSIFSVECLNVGSGKIAFTLGPEQVNDRQGLHYAEIHCYTDTVLKKVFKCCLLIEKSFAGSDLDAFSPLTILDVRMQLYDTSAKQNVLLDDLLFSDIVLAKAIQRAVADWNLMPPILSRNLSVATFPYKSNLCTGAVGHALKMAAYRYNRNQMRHANAGLSLDDNDKGQMYTQMAEMALKEWRDWVMIQKTQLNMMLAMGSISDVYMLSSRYWW